MSKSTDECSLAEIQAAEAYAVLRQVRFYLGLAAPTPRATEETRTAVREFCERYEMGMFPRRPLADGVGTLAGAGVDTGAPSQEGGTI